MLLFVLFQLDKDTKDFLQAATLVLGVIVALGAAGKVISNVLKGTIAAIKLWFVQTVRDVVSEELQPLKDRQERHAQIFEGFVRSQDEIKEIVSELLPNGGSHFRDIVTELNKNVQELRNENRGK